MKIKKSIRGIFDKLLYKVYMQQNTLLHLQAKVLLKDNLYTGGG